jgi:hypothetical protein
LAAVAYGMVSSITQDVIFPEGLRQRNRSSIQLPKDLEGVMNFDLGKR